MSFCFTSVSDGWLFNKLDDTINTCWFVGKFINKDICRVHVFKIQTVTNIVYAFAFAVVTETFCSNSSCLASISQLLGMPSSRLVEKRPGSRLARA